MLRRLTICGLFVLFAGLAVAEQFESQQPLVPAVRTRSQTRRRPANVDPSLEVTPQPQPAPVPPPFTPSPGAIPTPAVSTPNPQPAAALPPTVGPTIPPVVTYRDGLLTVQALNSTLGSVLAAIRNKTGIEFEGGESALDLVAISLGPAPEGDVLSAIFSGSSFDFVALGRPDSPGIVQRVILKPNSKNSGPTAAANASPSMRQQTPRVIQNGDEEENVPEEQVNSSGEEQPQDMPVQPPPTAQAPPRSLEQMQLEMQERRQKQQQQIDDEASHAPRKQPPF